jgi:hypothetical protein
MLQNLFICGSKPVGVTECPQAPRFQYRLVTLEGANALTDLVWSKADCERLLAWIEDGIVPTIERVLQESPKGVRSYGLVRFTYPSGDWVLTTGLASSKLLRELVAIKSKDFRRDLKKLTKLPVTVSSSLPEELSDS